MLNAKGLLLSIFMMSFLGVAEAAPTVEQCSRNYNMCSKDIKYMFNKKHCKKERKKCESAAAVNQQQTNTKNAMMAGQKNESVSDFDTWKKKEDARRRLEDRNLDQSASRNNEQSMREQMMGRNANGNTVEEAKKAAAIERAKMRQNQNVDGGVSSGQDMRKSLKK